jgi:hypothetical protein
MDLKLHPEAAKSFDAMAERLVERLKDLPALPLHVTPSFAPGVLVSGHISEKDIIGDFRVSQIAPVSGAEVGRLWVRGGERFGLRDESVAQFARLVEKLRAVARPTGVYFPNSFFQDLPTRPRRIGVTGRGWKSGKPDQRQEVSSQLESGTVTTGLPKLSWKRRSRSIAARTGSHHRTPGRARPGQALLRCRRPL